MLAWPPRSFRRRAIIALLVLASAGVVGCEPQIAVELVDVVAVEPARIDAGHRLRVTGHRFLLGHPCTFALRGAWHRPGRPPEHREHTIEGEASSGEAAEAIVTEDVIRALGGRATFVGELEVRFAAATIPGGTVHGLLEDVTLDFVPSARGTTRGELADIERALGARLAEASEEPGAEVAEVLPGGLAESLGVTAGDRIVARGRLNVLEAGDLALEGVPTAERALHVVRDGSEPFELRAAVPVTAPSMPASRAHQLAALLVLLAVALGLGARRRGASEAVQRIAGPAHVVTASVVAMLIHRSISSGLVSDVGTLAGVGVLAIGLSGATAGQRNRWSALVTAARALALAATALGAAALSGTTDLVVLSARAAGDVTEWPGLSTALGPAAAFGLVVACVRPTAAIASLLASALDALVLGVAAALATVVLFGGAGGPDPAAALVFVVRALVVAAGIALARPTLAALAPPALTALGVASAGLSALAAYVALVEPLVPSAAAVLAETLGAALVLLLGMAALARRRAPLGPEHELEL